LNGVSKDLFSSFWDQVKQKYMKGSREFFIHLTPGNLLSISSFRAFGRILQHGYLLTRHLPLFLNKAQLFFLLTSNMPSDAMVVEGFLSSVSELDETILRSTIGKASLMLISRQS